MDIHGGLSMAYKKHKGVRIKPENFSDEMNRLLDAYGESAFSVTMDITKRISDEAAYMLRTAGSFKDRRGKYRKNWVAELRKYAGRFKVIATVYNKKEYRLTHLLEKGHLAYNQYGDSGKKTKAYSHIADVEDWAIKAYEEGLREGLSRVE